MSATIIFAYHLEMMSDNRSTGLLPFIFLSANLDHHLDLVVLEHGTPY